MHLTAILMVFFFFWQLLALRRTWNVNQGHTPVAKVLSVLPFWYAIFQMFGKSRLTVALARVVKMHMELRTVIDGILEPISDQIERKILYQPNFLKRLL